MAISKFTEWLRTRTNKHDRPFQEDTITAHRDMARALHRWMTEQGIDDDFTACDTAILNRFFESRAACQTGHYPQTRQSGAEGCRPPHLGTDIKLARAVPVTQRPATLGDRQSWPKLLAKFRS